MMSFKEETETPKKKKRYLQKYNKTWETNAKYCDWLTCSSRGMYFAYCTACNVDLSLNAGVTDLSKHAMSKKHIKCMAALPQPPADENIAYVNDIMSDHLYGHKAKSGIKTACEGKDEIEADRNKNGSSVAVQDFKRFCTSKRCSFVNKDHNCYGRSSCNEKEDELDIFGKHVTAQLRKLPEEYSVGLILDIQNLITQKRLQAISEQNAQSANFT